jgi:DNA-binding NtrC family response regulator
MARILIVDDEESVRKVLAIQTRRMGHEPRESENGADAWKLLQSESFDVVITDLKMPEMDGLELLNLIRKNQPQIPVIMITAHGTIDTAVEAMKRGAFDYITKPFNQEEFLKTLERAILTSASMSKEFQRSRTFLRQEEKIIGSTEEMQKVYALIERVSNSTSSVLITGESGTGKEVVVRLLHDKSERRTSPLVTAHISACPLDEQSDHLFGTDQKQGWIELAAEGSLYFDEIGALDLGVQAQLYDTLTTGSYKRSDRQIDLKCRIIAASDYNLLEKIEHGAFRKDLFYCLNVVPIYLPPLRERTQDIEPLVDHFIKIFSRKFHKSVNRIDDEAVFHLIQYPWPGNIRELENSIEYAVNIVEKPVITKTELPPHLFSTPISSFQSWKGSAKDGLLLRIESLERSAIEDALKSSNGDILRASQKLGVPPSMLEAKVASLKILTPH